MGFCMSQWCANCKSHVNVIAGKNELKICFECGCELSLRPEESLKTVALFKSLLDLDSGIARYPGELANLESNLELAPEVPLETSRYLPSDLFDISARDVEFSELWQSEQLLERIIQLEQTFALAENLIADAPVETENPMIGSNTRVTEPTPASAPLLRIDSGHIATPDQVRSYNEAKSRRAFQEQSSEQNSADGPSQAVSNVQLSSSTAKFRVDSGHQFELPIAKPIGSIESASNPILRKDIGHSEHLFESTSWDRDSKIFTAAALGTAWVVQLLIGLAVVSDAPLVVWSMWLVAETVGTICLGRVGWQMLRSRDAGNTSIRVAPRFAGQNAANREKRATQLSNID
ncbi:MAG: hypothetical protein JNL67_11630 [Planctomycetaceae bacterium]|nr:hypothetical protein [Planctomycetaceae bacterium]